MAKRRKRGPIFQVYNCTITNRKFKVYGKAPSPTELVCVPAYYELHPDEDDRPELVKKQVATVEYASYEGPTAEEELALESEE